MKVSVEPTNRQLTALANERRCASRATSPPLAVIVEVPSIG